MNSNSKPVTLPITAREFLALKEQAQIDAIKWHETMDHFKPGPTASSSKDAYEAGFEQGWRDCLNMLRVHGRLSLSTNG